jgi:hypothetical protein
MHSLAVSKVLHADAKFGPLDMAQWNASLWNDTLPAPFCTFSFIDYVLSSSRQNSTQGWNNLSVFRNTETYSIDSHTFRPYVSDCSHLVMLKVYVFSSSICERRVFLVFGAVWLGTLSIGIWRCVTGNLFLDILRPILCLETRGPKYSVTGCRIPEEWIGSWKVFKLGPSFNC